MKFLIILPFLFAAVSCQFGGFGGGIRNFGNVAGNAAGNVANAFQRGAGNVASRFNAIPGIANVKDFGEFAAQSGKNYVDAADQRLHEGLFKASKNLVDANNAAFAAGKSTYQLALNTFADITDLEFLKKFTGNIKSKLGDAKASRVRQPAEAPKGQLPDSFDWREKGGVTPVQFQGDCGSCWTFATTGAIEGHVFRKTGKLPNLSKQNLVDCGTTDFGLSGCDGGFQEYAFAFITEEQKGIAGNDAYPYLDKQGTCSYKANTKSAEIKGFATIKPGDEKTMKEVIAQLGPLACSINGLKSLLLYTKGIYNDAECNNGDVNHSVLVVGYGSENGQDYWIVKNSWDTTWGEDGYFRLPRGSNFCKIASECSYPIV